MSVEKNAKDTWNDLLLFNPELIIDAGSAQFKVVSATPGTELDKHTMEEMYQVLRKTSSVETFHKWVQLLLVYLVTQMPSLCGTVKVLIAFTGELRTLEIFARVCARGDFQVVEGSKSFDVWPVLLSPVEEALGDLASCLRAVSISKTISAKSNPTLILGIGAGTLQAAFKDRDGTWNTVSVLNGGSKVWATMDNPDESDEVAEYLMSRLKVSFEAESCPLLVFYSGFQKALSEDCYDCGYELPAIMTKYQDTASTTENSLTRGASAAASGILKCLGGFPDTGRVLISRDVLGGAIGWYSALLHGLTVEGPVAHETIELTWNATAES